VIGPSQRTLPTQNATLITDRHHDSDGIQTRNSSKDLPQSLSLDHAGNELGANAGISPITGHRCPEVSRKLRFPDYLTITQDGGEVVSLRHRSLFTPQEILLVLISVRG